MRAQSPGRRRRNWPPSARHTGSGNSGRSEHGERDFLAEHDSHLRSCMSVASDARVDGDGVDRPFGGV
eukprot:3281321-Pyramimonas_sp.AAC.1